MKKIAFVSLGCAKNLIDSEIMLGALTQAGMAITPETSDADCIVINTCSFINDAKVESINALKDVIEEKQNGQHPLLIAAGCLPQRYSKELPALMPEIDAFIGVDEIEQIASIVERLFENKERSAPECHVTAHPQYIPDYDTPRFLLTPPHSAYIKIAEGCNHHCSFCIIPKLRGRHRSRSIESIVKEARNLVQNGVREINLISQDTTFFGMDKWDEKANRKSGVDSSKGESLAMLLRELDKIEGDFWIRLLYTHPAHWSDELIETIAECKKVTRYIDIPLQHISDNMLHLMQRETNGEYIRDLLQRIRKRIPDIVIRTTFITGFPGETEEDFNELLEFLVEEKFERVGVFAYSREEDTRAYKLDKKVHHMTAKKRQRMAMELQAQITQEINESHINKTLKVLVEAPGTARSEMDAPEIDPIVKVPENLEVGEFHEVTIHDWEGYDLIGDVDGATHNPSDFRHHE